MTLGSLIEDALSAQWPVAIAKYREEIDKLRDGVRGNHVIYQGARGGSLRGDRGTREKLAEMWDSKPHRFLGLLCNKRRLHGGMAPSSKADKESEVAFVRTMFNSGSYVQVHDHGSLTPLQLVAYEAPLLRKSRMDDGRPRLLTCDLVGIRERRLSAVEVKTHQDPRQSNTALPYALLEAFAYGHLIYTHLLERTPHAGMSTSHAEEVCKEICLCLETYSGFAVSKCPDISAEPEFMVAGPRSYFEGMLGDRDVMRRAREIEGALPRTGQADAGFAGYLVVSNDFGEILFNNEHEVAERRKRAGRTETGVKTVYTPRFAGRGCRGTLLRDIRELEHALRKPT